jgi:hypothetical protein
VVVDEVGDVVVVVDEVVVVEVDELVVVDFLVVVVVGSSTGSRPPFKRPKGSLAPEAGLPTRVDGLQVGNSTRFCFVVST